MAIKTSINTDKLKRSVCEKCAFDKAVMRELITGKRWKWNKDVGWLHYQKRYYRWAWEIGTPKGYDYDAFNCNNCPYELEHMVGKD